MKTMRASFVVPCSALAAQDIRREPLVLTQGGTPEKPVVFDGRGIIIDLGIDITDREWMK